MQILKTKLEQNRKLKESYKNQILNEFKNMGHPIEVSSVKHSKPKMPPIRVFPSRKLLHEDGTKEDQEEKNNNKPEKGILDSFDMTLCFKSYWYPNNEFIPWKPKSREGPTLTTVNKYVVLYGGISFEFAEDVSIYDTSITFR